MKWTEARTLLKTGQHIVRASERRDEVESNFGGLEVRYMGREGIFLAAGFDEDMRPVEMVMGTNSKVPVELTLEDFDALDWELL
jgi:hypothetical protein